MNRKTFILLAAIAAVLGLLAVLGQNRDATRSIAGASAGRLLLPELTTNVDGIHEIRITGAGGERLVSLERGDGGAWSVTEQDGYPAATGRINDLLIDLAETRIVEEKTANPEFFSRLGVEPVDAADAGGLELTLSDEADGQYELILGDSYGDGQRYARVADAELSVLIDRDPDVARSAADWVLPLIVDIDGERVQRVEIMHADGERLVIRKNSRDATDFGVDDLPEGRELQYAGVANVVGDALQELNLDAVARQPDEPGESVAVTELRTFDGLIVTVTARAADDEGDPWLDFSARFDAAQAEAFAESADDAEADTEDADAGDAEVDADGAETGDTDAEATADVAAEAAAINERLAGWRYRIPPFKYGQLTRRLEDLLRDPPEADDDE